MVAYINKIKIGLSKCLSIVDKVLRKYFLCEGVHLERKVWMGFHIVSKRGPCLTPQRIQFWKEEDFKKNPPEKPLHFNSDALVGLACVHLNQHLKNPFSTPKMNYPFCFEAWQAMEPHHQLFEKAQLRIHSLRSHMKEFTTTIVSSFEKSMSEVFSNSLQPWGIDLESFADLIESIDFLESKMERPLLYNFSLKMSKPMLEKLNYLHSLLFNLRALVAMEHNAYIHDPTYEAIKVDSISDYLAKADYVANDALLYYHFKKQKGNMPEKTFDTVLKSFMDFSHNGACLIENLPKSFLQSMNQEQLEESLYLLQMDWLLGTDAGLLFRVREELFALEEGYENIFWPELQNKSLTPHKSLSVSCELSDRDVFPTAGVA